jgi:hypothetical protein
MMADDEQREREGAIARAAFEPYITPLPDNGGPNYGGDRWNAGCAAIAPRRIPTTVATRTSST